MNTDRRPICPACLQIVRPTRWGGIQPHRDSIGRDACPAAGYPFIITGGLDELVSEGVQ